MSLSNSYSFLDLFRSVSVIRRKRSLPTLTPLTKLLTLLGRKSPCWSRQGGSPQVPTFHQTIPQTFHHTFPTSLLDLPPVPPPSTPPPPTSSPPPPPPPGCPGTTHSSATPRNQALRYAPKGTILSTFQREFHVRYTFVIRNFQVPLQYSVHLRRNLLDHTFQRWFQQRQLLYYPLLRHCIVVCMYLSYLSSLYRLYILHI